MRANSAPSRAAMRGSAGSSAGSIVIARPSALPGSRRITKNGFPITSGLAQAKSGSGTATPAACAALRIANSSTRPRLDGTPVAASVRNTSRCVPASRPPTNSAPNPQFSWIAPPARSSRPAISTRSAPLASARKRASAASDGGDAVAAIDRDDRAGHIGARRRDQEQERPVEILGLRNALQRNAVDQVLAGLGLEELAIEVGLDIARRQRVDEYPVTRQLHRQHAGQMKEPGLGGAIGRHPPDRAKAEHRGDVDDAAGTLALNKVMR